MGFEPVTDPVKIFAVVMIVLLMAPVLMEKARLVASIGLILSGAVLGPGALGVLERDRTFELLGTVGLLYLMFLVGLTLDFNELSRHRRRGLLFGLTTFMVPAVLGTLASGLLLGLPWDAALLLGSMVGTHTLVAYPVCERLGIVGNNAVTVTSGGSMVADTLGILVLAAVVGAQAETTGLLYWVQFAAVVTAWFAGTWLALPRIGRWFFRSPRDDPQRDFLFLMVALFGSAVLAAMAGLEPIIGAFLAGLALNRLVPDTSPLMTRVRFVGQALFIPFFLISVGMLVDFGELGRDASIWMTAAMLGAVVIIGKTLAAKGLQRPLGYSAAEGWVMAGLSMPQAAATLAIGLVGFQIGLFGEGEVNAVILLILLTCIIGPFIVQKYGRQVALESPASDSDGARGERLLVSVSNPDTARALMDFSFLLRDPVSTEPIYPLSVAPDDPEAEHHVAESELLLENAVVHAAAADVPVVPVTRVDMHPAGGIIRAVRELRITTVLVGFNSATSTRDRLLGSLLDQLLELGRQHLFVCRMAAPLAATQRVVVIVPPLMERQRGFAPVRQMLKPVVTGIGHGFALAATGQTLTRLRKPWERLGAIKGEDWPLEDWGLLLETLKQKVKADDMLLLVSPRRGTLAWQAGMDRLPARLVSSFPGCNVITLYPALDSDAPGDEGGGRRAGRPALACGPPEPEIAAMVTPSQVMFQSDLARAEQVLAALSERLPLPPAGQRQAREMLLRHAERFAIELSPGTILIHGRLRHLDRPMLCLATSARTMALASVRDPVHLLVVLLAPWTRAQADHLATLRKVAAWLKQESVIEAISRLETYEQLEAMLASPDDG